jgi:hypothetical protein
MGITDWFSPERSTAAWAAKLFREICKGDWSYARENRRAIFEEMIRRRPGTPSTVMLGVTEGYVEHLSALCTVILANEAIQVDPDNLPLIEQRLRDRLLAKGIPADLC